MGGLDFVEKVLELTRAGVSVTEKDYLSGRMVDAKYAEALEILCDVHVVTDSELGSGREMDK
ncbi:MAG: hypothetical protein WCT49_01540 [Candidatus Paceibacterota bacterium]|jgi:hypothetical protein|nr:hypothetical protein [Candidatus Paceibacterota bacterium]